ncbi:hypothetical protein OENI_1230001 [Oenococcus oeni]|nr:hypothetical protein OENI_1230001 [Oenococcus oeni]
MRHTGGTLEAVAAQFKILRTKQHKEFDNALEASGSIFAIFHKTVSLDVIVVPLTQIRLAMIIVCIASLGTKRKTRSMRTYNPPKSCGVNRAKTLYQKSPLATTKSNP